MKYFWVFLFLFSFALFAFTNWILILISGTIIQQTGLGHLLCAVYCAWTRDIKRNKTSSPQSHVKEKYVNNCMGVGGKRRGKVLQIQKVGATTQCQEVRGFQ